MLRARSSQKSGDNPLGLNLDFLFGKGFLWARHEPVSDWIALEHLRMEIPDITFPFDASTGLHRFQNTRCLVREVEISTSEVGLGDLLMESSKHVDGFDDLSIRFLEGAIHISVRVRALGADSFLSFRAALIPPEPSRLDEIHLSLYDYRAYGPLPWPARLLAFELMTRLLHVPGLRPPGRGESFTVGVAGDILSFRPLKLLLLHIFPGSGWKLPNLSDVVLDGAFIRPGALHLRASSRDKTWARPVDERSFSLGATVEGARALAAYEAKDLFSHIDEAIFERDNRQALDLIHHQRDVYGLHPELIGRKLDLLLADPTAANLAEVESLCRQLEKEDPEDLQALLYRPSLAVIRGKLDEAMEAYDRLAQRLKSRGQIEDWILCELAAAQLDLTRNPERAAGRYQRVLEASPRNRIALEGLKQVWETLGETTGLEEILKRLTGVYTDRESLSDTYMQLAHHLMNRVGEPAEARIYLERVLRIDPARLEALETLGESYLLQNEPLRALKAFGSAARAAQSAEELGQAVVLYGRIARLWDEEISDAAQALLSCRRAISILDMMPHSHHLIVERAELLEHACKLSMDDERWEEGIGYAVDVIALWEQIADQKDSSMDGNVLGEKIIAAHRNAAILYEARGRPDAALSHHRRVAAQSDDEESWNFLERYYRDHGEISELATLYSERLKRVSDPEEATGLEVRLAETFHAAGQVDAAIEQLESALRKSPAHPRARNRIAEFLINAQRTQRLREILQGLLIRVQDRAARKTILMELGHVEFQHLGRPREAAKIYLEAHQLDPLDRTALFRARDTFEHLQEEEGHQAAWTGEASTVGKMLERLWMKTIEISADEEEITRAWKKIATHAAERQDRASYDRAMSKLEGLEVPGEREKTVDRRLDEILQDAFPETLLPEENTSPRLVSPDLRENMESLGSEHSEPDEERGLQSFRDRLADVARTRAKIPKLDDVPEDSPMARILKKSPRKPPGESGAATSGEVSVEQALALARRSADDRLIMDALDALIAARDLSAEEASARRAEAAELAYFELEDPERARPHLEWLRENDPDGRGAQPAILNALEAIYEESGEVDARIKLLQTRLAAAQSADMETVYRLLLAQLVWDAHQDAAHAKQILAPVLQSDPRHEAAHRLMAEFARERQDYEEMVRCLLVVLETSAGGLDAIEVEREIASIYLDKLERPGPAEKHYEKVLEAAPGDAMALDGIKRAQVSRLDWEGYARSLVRELALLGGRIEKPSDVLDLSSVLQLDPSSIPDALRVPASQIVSDIAHVVENELKRMEAASDLWGKVHAIWPEQVEAIERRIALNRELNRNQDLAQDLESYADLLLDARDRFEVLVEAAGLQVDMGAPDRARPLYTEALALVEGLAPQPEGVHEARRALKALGE